MQGEYKILDNNGEKLLRKPSPSFEKLLDRITNDGASPRKYLEQLEIIGLVVLMVLFTCCELALVISGVDLKEWVWNLGTKLCSIVSGK